MTRTLIAGGVVGTGSGMTTADVLVEDGSIARIGPDLDRAADRIVDAEGHLVEGYAFEDCETFVGDDTSWIVSWKDGKQFGALQRRAVQLSVRIRNGRLYSISGEFEMLTAKEGMRYMNHGTPPDPRNWGP